MSLINPDWRAAQVFKDDRRNTMMVSLDVSELNRRLGQFYQDLVLKGIPSPEMHVDKLREILEGKTQPGT